MTSPAKATAKKPFTPAPRMNVLKDQLKEQRFALITKVKTLREQRIALKGVKGTGQQWAELSTQIDEVQAKIDMLSKSLGLPVKEKPAAAAPRTEDRPRRPIKRQHRVARNTGLRRDEITIIGAESGAEKSQVA